MTDATCRDCGVSKPMDEMFCVGSENLCRDCAIIAVLLQRRIPDL